MSDTQIDGIFTVVCRAIQATIHDRVAGMELVPETALAEIGVDSIEAMEIAAYIEDHMGIVLGEGVIDRGATLGHLARIVSETAERMGVKEELQ